MLASCQPELIAGKPFDPDSIVKPTAAQVEAGLTFSQYADAACTTPDEAGNYLKFNCSTGVVRVISGGKELATAAGGVVSLPVKRGQEPVCEVTFRYYNFDGSTVEVTKTFKCTPPTELAQEMLYLVSDNGKKVWKYSNVCPGWGNAGHSGSGEDFANFNVDCKWWGFTSTEGALDQPQHNGDAANFEKDADYNSFMIFTEDGTVTCYTPTGEPFRSGKFDVKDYDPTRSSGWQIGKLVTDVPALLWPWVINGDAHGVGAGAGVTEFDIMELNGAVMTLTYTTPDVGSGSWSEITFWQFMAATMEPTSLEGKWGWSSTSTAWGNAGHSGAGAGFNGPGVVDGKWWGVDSPEGLLDQPQHSGDGKNGPEGDGNSDAYMIFEGNTVTSYNAAGEKIRGGDFTVVLNDPLDGAGRSAKGWELGTLTTSEPALLFPWVINGDAHGVGAGAAVPAFDIMYFDSCNMTLTYTTPDVSSGSWQEISFWCFERKR